MRILFGEILEWNKCGSIRQIDDKNEFFKAIRGFGKLFF